MDGLPLPRLAALATGVTLAAVPAYVIGAHTLSLLPCTVGIAVIATARVCDAIRQTARPTADAYEEGYEAGYDRGWRDGQRDAKPSLTLLVPPAQGTAAGGL